MGRSGSGSGAERARVLSLDADARGLAKTERGMEVTVPGVLPGELVQLGIAHVDRRGHGYGALERVLEASPERVNPACKHFLTCGGCDLLHAPIAIQHTFKRKLVAAALGLPLESVEPVVASPRELGYRALAKLVAGEGGVLGSYAPRSHDVADMAGCVVHAPEVERVADFLRRELRGKTPAGLRYVIVRASIAEASVLVTFVVRESGSARVELGALAALLAGRSDVAAVYLHENHSSGDELYARAPFEPLVEKSPLYETIGGARYRLRPGAFAQVNPLGAAELYARVVELAAPSGKNILDLYSGSGGISLALARNGARAVVAVEEVPGAVEAARASALENNFADIVTVAENSAEDGTIAAAAGHELDVVVLNPPRKGASTAVLDAVAGYAAPERIVYVSCNPETLARDLRYLAGDYRLVRVIPVDLFPSTRHVETVVLLERIKSGGAR